MGTPSCRRKSEPTASTAEKITKRHQPPGVCKVTNLCFPPAFPCIIFFSPPPPLSPLVALPPRLGRLHAREGLDREPVPDHIHRVGPHTRPRRVRSRSLQVRCWKQANEPTGDFCLETACHLASPRPPYASLALVPSCNVYLCVFCFADRFFFGRSIDAGVLIDVDVLPDVGCLLTADL